MGRVQKFALHEKEWAGQDKRVHRLKRLRAS